MKKNKHKKYDDTKKSVNKYINTYYIINYRRLFYIIIFIKIIAIINQ